MINVRERDQIWNCPTNPIASDDGPPDAIPSPDRGAGLPAPFPGLVTKDLEPGTPAPEADPDHPIPPPPPGFYYNQSFWVTGSCGGSAPTNTVSFLVPADIYMASTQEAANLLAYNAFLPACIAQLNCDAVTVVAVVGSPDSFEVLGFEEEQHGGYWFSDPQPFLGDGFVVNTPV